MKQLKGGRSSVNMLVTCCQGAMRFSYFTPKAGVYRKNTRRRKKRKYSKKRRGQGRTDIKSPSAIWKVVALSSETLWADAVG